MSRVRDYALVQSLRLLRQHTPCWYASLGLSLGWGVAVLCTMAVLLWQRQVTPPGTVVSGLLVGVMAVGWVLGKGWAQRLCTTKVEWGLVPLGLGGMAISALSLGYLTPGPVVAALSVLVLGGMAGIALTPGMIFLARQWQQDAVPLRTASWALSVLGILGALGLVWVSQVALRLPAASLFHMGAGLALVGFVGSMYLVPAFVIRFVFWLLTHTLYRIRIVGQPHIPEHGPALLLCNHMSFVDGFLVAACVQRFIRFMMHRPFYELPVLHHLFRLGNAIPIVAGERSDVEQALALARQELLAGHVVCIFAEGAISRTGNLLRFRRGFETIMQGLDVPVIPVHLDRLWGSPFSFKSGRLLWQWPRPLPYPVTVSFGAPLPGNVRAPQVRQAIMELGSQAVAYRRQPHDLLHLRCLRTARRRLGALCMADETQRYRGYAVLAKVFWLARWLQEQAPAGSRLGLALPPSATTALTHVAALCAGMVPVPLSPDLSRQDLLMAMRQADLHMVVTSRETATAFKDIPRLTLLYVEDASASQRWWHTCLTTLQALVVPYRVLQRRYWHPGQQAMGLATVVFTSGSSGPPKGVMLSHHNILSNLESIAQVFELSQRDCMLGTLPLHHAFGLTVTLWLPLISGFGIIYQAEMLDAERLVRQIQRYKTTFFVSTPAGYAHYLQHCPVAALASLRHAISGGDTLPAVLAEAFQTTYGLPLLEGYGCTEMAPVIAVNVPDAPYGSRWHTGTKRGTVGHPLPGVAVKVVHPRSGEVLPYGEEGMLLVQGPNRMLGYLAGPEHTAAVLRDGWFVTGDTGSMDEDGFLRLTGHVPGSNPTVPAVSFGRW